MNRRMLLGLLAAAGLPGCHKKPDDGTAPVPEGALKPLALRDDTPDLMLTWLDDKGDTHVELKPPDVPAAGRAMVRVVVADREDGTGELFYVADLTKPNADGSYPTRSMRRHEWEAEIEKRREAYLVKAAPPPTPTAAPQPAPTAGGAPVIIYGASWCGPCHQALGYLKSKGVPVVMKDIEETPGAEAEMQAKLAKAGRRGGQIPVIDVRGQIIVGFSPGAVDQALAKAGAGTML
jgi:glutaredoxin